MSRTVILSLLLLGFTSVKGFTAPVKLQNVHTTTQTEISLSKSNDNNNAVLINPIQQLKQLSVTVFVACTMLVSSSTVVWADGQTDKFKFPPIDKSDTNRCILKGSNMGQANAARDKLYDLRQCQLSGVKAIGYDLSGVSKLSNY